uniref:Sieve element occlusion N-terminal domain-containing protein n=1 Tax=Quercus lobata TaxID=97700 RepID=A0A7N2LM01_QUELO
MASNQVPQVSTQKAIEDELSVSTMSNNQIMDQISATHVHADKNFDAESLFIVVKSILNSAIHVDNTLDTTQAQQETAREARFSPPLCTLKQLSFELHQSDLLAKSVGILKGVPTILESSWLLKHKDAIDELNNLRYLFKSSLDRAQA